MPGEKFEYRVVVSLGDTNLEGNAYWTHYFEWIGKARESFLMSICPDFMTAVFAAGIRIMTHQTDVKHISSAFFPEKVILEVRVGEIKKTSTKLLFDFVKEATHEKIAEAWQVLVFANSEGKPIPIPPEIKEAGLKYLVE